MLHLQQAKLFLFVDQPFLYAFKTSRNKSDPWSSRWKLMERRMPEFRGR